MGADSDMIKSALLVSFDESSELHQADLALRHASHVHAHAKGDLAKVRARQTLRLAALQFSAAVADVAKGGGS